MRCIVIDDEPMAIELLESYISRVPTLEHVQSFQDPTVAIEFCGINEIDLVLLDINMPDLSGIKVAQQLLPKPRVVFSTAHGEHAVTAFDIGVCDFLMKPFPFERFLKAIQRVGASLAADQIQATDEHFIFVRSGNERVRLDIDELRYVESARNYVLFHTADETILSLMSMSKVLDLLPARQFVRCHRSYIVSKSHVDAVSNAVVTVSGTEIPIGETYKKEFHTQFPS